jgi:plastocyanin
MTAASQLPCDIRVPGGIMRSRSSSVAAASVAAFTLAALLFGCSSKDSPTATPPPVTGPTFNFTVPQQGTSHQRTFTEIGSWNYVCTTHAPGMAGTVVVAASGLDSQTVHLLSGSNQFSPASGFTIKQGGSVRWVNDGTMSNHTVTR